MVRLNRLRHEERGGTLVFFAITLVVMLGFSALVIDLGAARQMRRQSAASADASSLGSAQDLPNLTAAAAEVMDLAEKNFNVPVSAWATCEDDDALPQQGTDTSECISFDHAFTRVRVRIPDTEHDTFFASVLGYETLTVNAAAEATKQSPGFGSIQPYGLYSTWAVGADSGHVCLKTGTSGFVDSTPPCNGPATGNFNTLDIQQYGNDTLGSDERCGGGDNIDRLKNNIALGVDHEVSIWSGTTVRDNCWIASPNTVAVRTGNAGAFDEGLRKDLALDDGQPARLQRGSWSKRTVAGRSLDNRGLWEYIGDGVGDNISDDVPFTCARSVFTTIASSGSTEATKKAQLRQALETCFAQYNTSTVASPVAGCSGPCTGDVFTRNTVTESGLDLYDIQTTPRFAYVPVFRQSTPPPGASADVQIAGFRPVFMQRLFAGCNANCAVDFEPGTGTTSMGALNDATTALTGFVFNPEMLPGTIGTDPFAVGETLSIQLVR